MTSLVAFYYSYFVGCGHELRNDPFDADPINLPAIEIVERVLGADYVPEVDRPQSIPFPMHGQISTVEREDQTFLVSVDHDSEAITVQEVRADRYAA